MNELDLHDVGLCTPPECGRCADREREADDDLDRYQLPLFTEYANEGRRTASERGYA